MSRFTFVLLAAAMVVFSGVLAGCSDRDAANESVDAAAAPPAGNGDTQHGDDETMEHGDAGHGSTAAVGHDQGAAHEEQEGMAHEHGEHAGMQGASHWNAPAEAAALTNPITADAASVQRGRDRFVGNCATCHGDGGRGDGPVSAALTPKPADLVVMAPMHPAGDFFWKIKNGRGAMPAWKNTLSDEQIWDLVNYIKSLGKGESADEEAAESHGSDHIH